MKKISLFVIAVAAMLLTACNGGQKENEAAQARIDSLVAANQMTVEELQDYVDLVNSISASIDVINSAEGAIYDTSKEGTDVDKREVVKEKLKALAETVNAQRQHVEDLEKKLGKSGQNAKQLKAVIDLLKAQLDEKDKKIAQLEQAIEDKDYDINNLRSDIEYLTKANDNLNETVQNQKDIMKQQDNILNEGYVLVAEKSKLKSLGVLKKSKVVAENIDNNEFQKIDIRRFSKLEIPSKKPVILSQMPAGSYTMTTNGGVTTLTVTDATKFWSVTKFLIIQQ